MIMIMITLTMIIMITLLFDSVPRGPPVLIICINLTMGPYLMMSLENLIIVVRTITMTRMTQECTKNDDNTNNNDYNDNDNDNNDNDDQNRDENGDKSAPIIMTMIILMMIM